MITLPTDGPSYTAPHRALWWAGSILGLTGVGLGAFGAHALKGRIDDGLLSAFETGVRYQLFHAVALLVVAWLAGAANSKAARTAGWLLTSGTVLFSGSLYLMAIGAPRWFGAITPFGGVCLMAAWVLVAIAGGRLSRAR